MIPMLNHAVTTLPCSQCTIMQSPPSHAPNVQSCSHHSQQKQFPPPPPNYIHSERSSLAGLHLEPPMLSSHVTSTCTIMQFQTSHVMCYIHMYNHAVTTLPCYVLHPHVQSCSSKPPMLPMYNHAVTTLPCSQCTIMQSPTSHAPNVQSCSHQPPMLPMHNHAVTTLPCSQCTIMQSPLPTKAIPPPQNYIHSERSSLAGLHLEPPMLSSHVTSTCTIMQFQISRVMCYIHMYNHAVTTLPCLAPMLHPHVQSCSHHPPMLISHVTSTCTIMQSPPSHAYLPCYIHMYNHAVTTLPCLSPMLHPHVQSCSSKSPVLCVTSTCTIMQFQTSCVMCYIHMYNHEAKSLQF